jgi:hypothetical protein
MRSEVRQWTRGRSIRLEFDMTIFETSQPSAHGIRKAAHRVLPGGVSRRSTEVRRAIFALIKQHLLRDRPAP